MILMMKVGEIFPLPAIDLAWDFALTDDVNDEGRLAVVAAVPCSELRRALEAATEANVKIRAAVPLAVGSAIIAQEMGLSEAAVVERADDGPAVDVVSNGSLRTSRAAPASAPMALEIARALGLAGLEDAPVVAAGGADVPNATRQTDRTALMALADASIDRLKLRLELPEAVAARAAASARRQIRVATVALAASALAFGVVAYDYYAARQEKEDAQRQSNARVQKLRNEEKKVKSEVAAQIAQKEALELAFAPPQKISEIVAVTTAAVPQGAWLKGLTIERGKPITLRGSATKESLVAEVTRRLAENKDGRFREVSITNASNTLVNKVPVTEFVLTAFPTGNLPFLNRTGGRTGR